MQLHIDTDNLSLADLAMLTALVNLSVEAGITLPEPEPEPAAPKQRRTRKAAAPAPEAEQPEATPEAEQLELPTLETAVSRATQLVSEGKQAQVKAALGKVGAKRVSELTSADSISKFLAELA